MVISNLIVFFVSVLQQLLKITNHHHFLNMTVQHKACSIFFVSFSLSCVSSDSSECAYWVTVSIQHLHCNTLRRMCSQYEQQQQYYNHLFCGIEVFELFQYKHQIKKKKNIEWQLVSANKKWNITKVMKNSERKKGKTPKNSKINSENDT